METTKKYANSDSPIEERMKQKDDETAAIQYCNKKNINIMRIGIDGDENDNKIKNITVLPRRIRNIPDFIVIKKDVTMFLECKKCGDNFKPKMKELESYKWWNNLHPEGILDVYFFIYNFDKFYLISFKSLIRLINENNFKTGEYESNNEPYYIIPKQELVLTGQEPIYFTIKKEDDK
tara:strand:+ start:222 stop:755 length:534 start_codon:yes stop_codon:yes gene_type:complete